MKLWALLFLPMTTSYALAQSEDIPQAVIAECNAKANASNFPTCLKEGAIAFQLLGDMITSDYYGPAAEPVVNACSARNDSYADTWTCFLEAARSAAETRDLIGIEDIADPCVAGISDQQMAARIGTEFMALRSERFPYETYYSSGSDYYPFQGCKDEGDQQSSLTSSIATIHTVSQETGSAISPIACSTYSEIQNLVQNLSERELRYIWTSLQENEGADAATIAQITGLSTASAQFILNANEDQAMMTGALLGAFLRKTHPSILENFLADSAQATESPAEQMGSDMAVAMFYMVLETAEEQYVSACKVR
ncbi:hypothetical protein [Marivita geojedonensis]|uniref:Uncharacterized protein n=1 Tax=Marivita geojedonensis TaxID=1123756 RepID=A0A1X4NFA4_9RHOB|nr:hypothetical protein [Marivita geojedonensis]OSQ45731.1 hypothetical protein MGEO_17690 [Marivita geojedonensis]PRY74053.1 hypothetical protein CLV76_12450 [Marivita geojedonensis]